MDSTNNNNVEDRDPTPEQLALILQARASTQEIKQLNAKLDELAKKRTEEMGKIQELKERYAARRTTHIV